MITTQPQNPKPPATTAVRPPASTMLEAMVAKILEMGMNDIAVSRESLYEHSGFTRAEIDAHAAEACDIARSRAVRAA